MNDVYLKTLGVDKFDFSLQEKNTLASVAYQNPIDGGKAVYSARVMLDTVLDDLAPEQSARNANQKIEKKENNKNEIVNQNLFLSSIYPNPNDGSMKFDYILPEKVEAVLVIYDIMGKAVDTYRIIGKGQLQINNSKLKGGIYFYEVRTETALFIKDKLIIIK